MLDFLRGNRKRTKVIWWVLIVVTVVTFVGGFVFLLGTGLSSRGQAQLSGAVGSVNGQNITRTEWQTALADQRADYKRRFGSEPTDRDAKMMEIQAWRLLVMQRLLGDEARKQGLKATDKEVMISLQSSPPPALANAPVFQTDGKFDPQKYMAALRDPSNNWAPFEEEARRQLPVRKLQERLVASIKLSEPELREAFRERYESENATVAFVSASTDTGLPQPTEAQLQATYEKFKNRFTSTARTQLEALVAPKKIGPEEIRTAREIAQSYVNRIRGGEDFAAIARDFSEGPGAEKGGVVDRAFSPSEFGPAMGPILANLNVGDVTDPFQDGTRFIIFKVVEKGTGAQGPTIKVAQIVVRIRPNEDELRKQLDELTRLAKRAKGRGLGAAAADAGYATQKTEFYDANSQVPQVLFGAPDAAEWGLTSKQGEVSPVFEGTDEFVVVQVAVQRAAGVLPREDVAGPLRQIADLEQRIDRTKPVADAIEKAIAQGRTLEQAAQAAGITPFLVPNLTRRQPDPRLSGSPEFIGALFGAPPGKVIGPVRGLNGWYFGRVESRTPADTAMFAQVKGQLTQEILSRRQQTFFNDYMNSLRAKASIHDLRVGP